ncbi:MAG: TorF family putative porin [Pseudomonadota bacterium]|nr:TorF family putative porin [Pseudomonadota bacterium]
MNALKLTALTAALAASVAVAQADDIITIPDVTVSGEVAFTTDYKFRGISQTSNNPAVQGALSLEHTSGLYATLWGSSVAASTGSEMNAVVGYVMPLNLGDYKASLDVGALRYIYAGDSTAGAEPDYNEVFANVAVESVVMADDEVALGFAFTNEYFAESDRYFNLNAGYSAPIADTNLGLVTHVGYNKFRSNQWLNKALGVSPNTGDDYIDYKVGGNASIQGIDAELAYVGTDIKKRDCAGGVCDGRVVLTLSKSF